jgi:hypothetical protein
VSVEAKVRLPSAREAAFRIGVATDRGLVGHALSLAALPTIGLGMESAHFRQ